jgi:hypothetical protein
VQYISEDSSAISEQQAESALAGKDLVTATAGTIADMKVLRDRCLAAGIPATIGCPGGGGCGPKTHLLIAEEQIPQIAQLFHNDWAAQIEAEGLPPVIAKAPLPEHEGEEPCPACGTAAPLVAGACSDCGLVLEG